ncbi:MAG: helix-turn-helix transcriptional regulator [Alphaproteobacteria bacterium]|nr:helix-turn-helix transcriptional regulator [Alphaproteobacteria bacterium]
MNLDILKIKQSALDHFRAKNPSFIKLCQPLQEIGIQNYYFIKCHEDGTYLAYSSKPEFFEAHIQTIRGQSLFFIDTVDIVPNSQISFSLTGDIYRFDVKADPVIGLLWKYDFWNTFMLYKIINNNLLEGWGFSLGTEVLDPLGFFLKNKSLLERFVNYFDVAGKDLMDTSDRKKLAVYDENFTFFKRRSVSKDIDKTLNFLRQTHLGELLLSSEGYSFHLTQRQCECLYYLSHHYTAKEIARFLHLSHRSIETYIQSIRDKIGVSSKSDLLQFIHKHELIQKLELCKRIETNDHI